MKSLSDILVIPTIDEFIYNKVICNYNILTNVFNENNALYKGLKELSAYLAKTIFYDTKNRTEFAFTKNDLKDYENVFYDKLQINITNDDVEGEYREDLTEFNKISKRIDTIYIDLNAEHLNNYLKLHQTIIHEMMHAWDDYEEYVNGHVGFKDLYNAESDYYKSIDFNNENDKIRYSVKRFNYFMTKTEVNAYIAQLDGMLGNNIRFNDVKDAFNFFKKTDIYKVIIHYFALFELYKFKNTETAKLSRKLWCDEYCKIYNSDESDISIINACYKKVKYAMDKLGRTIASIYFDYENNKKPSATNIKESAATEILLRVYNSEEAEEFIKKYGYLKR